MTRLVCTETIHGVIVRIFRTRKAATLSGAVVYVCPRDEAVSEIRSRVYDMAKGLCQDCGKYQQYNQGHLHEVVPRGRGGEVSVYNSIWLCYECHINGRHGTRKPRFGECSKLKE